MVERPDSIDGSQDEHLDLSQLKKNIESSIDQHTGDEEIIRELEAIKNALEDTTKTDQQKLIEIKDDLQKLQEKGIVFDYLTALENKVDAMAKRTKEHSEQTDGTTPQKLLEQLAHLPQAQRDEQILQLAEQGREKSEEHISQTIGEMEKNTGVRGMIGRFFSSKI